MSHRIITVTGSTAIEGADVVKLDLKGAGTTIDTIQVGEEGRGRKLASLPCPPAPGRLMVASVGSTRAGRPRLNRTDGMVDDSAVIAVFRTPMGYRGGNQHTGGRAGWLCSRPGCKAEGQQDVVPAVCPDCGASGYSRPKRRFAAFPGEIIAEGTVAEGGAGRMGSGQQLVAVLKKDTVFRTRIFSDGRCPPAVYYGWWDGERIRLMTAEEWEPLQVVEEDAPAVHAAAVTTEDEVEQLRRQLRAWKYAIGREKPAHFRNGPKVRPVRDQVDRALRGGSYDELRVAANAIEALPAHDAMFGYLAAATAETPKQPKAVAPVEPEEPLADWEIELLGGPVPEKPEVSEVTLKALRQHFNG